MRDRLTALFATEYEKLFGRSVGGMEIEATVWSVNAYTEQAATHRLAEVGTPTHVKAERPAGCCLTCHRTTACGWHYPHGNGMQSGSYRAWPVVITEDETSVIVPNSRAITAHEDGTLDMSGHRLARR